MINKSLKGSLILLIVLLMSCGKESYQRIVIGVKEKDAMTNFTPIDVEETYGSVSKDFGIEGTTILKVSRSFSVSLGNYQEQHSQTISTVGSCLINTSGGNIHKHAQNDLVSVTDNFSVYNGELPFSNGYIAFKFGANLDKIGWIKITSANNHLMIDDCAYYFAQK